MDGGFPRRVCVTTAWVAILLALMMTSRVGGHAAAGLLVGAGLAIAGLLTIEWVLRRGSGAPKGGARRLEFAALLKLPLMAAAIALLAHLTRNDPRAMMGVAAGATLVPVVILLKFVGLALTGRAPGQAGSRRRGTDA
jgi:hypothetical protein